MTTLIYKMIDFITRVHSYILNWNDSSQTFMTDKQLHFWVIGLIGMGILLVVYPLFILLSKHHVLAIAGIYVFTLLIMVTFAIEIEQGLTGTGVMDFNDAISGLTGFAMMFIVFAIIHAIIVLIFHGIKRAMRHPDDTNHYENAEYYR